jgi:hypothetical protein
MSQVNVNQIVDASGGVLAPISSVMRNRIINGAMVISQRNGTSSITPTTPFGQYSVDRFNFVFTQGSKFSLQQNAGAVTPPAGFTNYLGCTSTSAYSVLSSDTFVNEQIIEGFNIADLGFGTANATTVTLSFWVRSSLTGTFGGSLFSTNGSTRSYPFNYSIPSANTWTKISVTIPGDTSGTWNTTNGSGMNVRFGLGSGSTYSGTAGAWATGNFTQPTGSVSVVGTNGATWYVTGVQLERGTQATSFEYRQYGQELALCQRYYQTVQNLYAFANNSTTATLGMSFPAMRSAPSGSLYSGTLTLSGQAADYNSTTAITGAGITVQGARFTQAGYTGLTTNSVYIGYANSNTNWIALSAEL